MSLTTTKPQTAAIALPERELMDVLRSSLYPGAKDESIRMVLGYCKARGLDPMKKPVHIVPMYNRDAGGMIDVIMPGVQSYRTDAARTGEYVGKTEPEFGPDVTHSLGGVTITFPKWCKITVRRLVHGNVCEYTAKEFWLENYATAKRDTQAPNSMWAKRPYGQIAKCAEAQALRMAFPEETGGTNTSDEMEGKAFEGHTIDAKAEPASRQVSAEAIPDLEEVDVLRDRVDRLIQALAKCDSEMKFIAREANAKPLLADIDAAGRDELKTMAVKALAAARERFVSVPVPEYEDAE